MQKLRNSPKLEWRDVMHGYWYCRLGKGMLGTIEEHKGKIEAKIHYNPRYHKVKRREYRIGRFEYLRDAVEAVESMAQKDADGQLRIIWTKKTN